MGPLGFTPKIKPNHLLPFTREKNFPKWYKSVLKEGKLAQNSAVSGCMNILKNGVAIWEKITSEFNQILNEQDLATNHYFPIFIPAKFFEKEAASDHMKGFAPECAVVTHLRMIKNADGKMIPDPNSKLEEPLVVRPTSELIIGEFFRETILEDNELPLKVNQWANVVRAEHHTRPFLRTMEFLWQEGHCAFANKDEAMENALKMAQVYAAFMINVCALPVIIGEKSEEERFAGAERTFCLEAMMQDGKAVQAGTSHYLGQNFAKMSDIQFKNKNNVKCNVETTSWGISTRLIGCLIMSHADDYGMRIPPRLAKVHIIVIPSGKKSEARDEYIANIQKVFLETKERFFDQKICIRVNNSDKGPGSKQWDAVREGYPIIMRIGNREVAEKSIMFHRRDEDPNQHTTLSEMHIDEIVPFFIKTLGEIQSNYLAQAEQFRNQHIRRDIKTEEELIEFFSDPNNKGFVRAKWSEDSQSEKDLKGTYGITIRCLPFDQDGVEGTCILTGKPATKEAIFAKAY
ncbi:MAG: aminoacyl--tRNA ligase-related protein [Parachlamydiaceae bacterium]|nr:aminoacyl--tRNA ligase-related protein [Parachlamydiaceae bacterium]